MFKHRFDKCKLYDDIVGELCCVVITAKYAAVFALQCLAHSRVQCPDLYIQVAAQTANTVSTVYWRPRHHINA